MSTQYSDVNKTYCSNCQTLSEYENQEIKITSCVAAYEFIKPQFYNQMIARIKKLHDFGDYDTTTRLPDSSNLSDKITLDYIDTDTYNNIASRVLSQYITKNKNDIIYGTYFTDLKTTVENYKIASTRYWICEDEHVSTCCDCLGECDCYGECDCSCQQDWCTCYNYNPDCGGGETGGCPYY